MRKLTMVLAWFLLWNSITYGALLKTATWEVRPGVGTDTNGGGFNTGAAGTDMSQFDNKNAAACTACQSTTANLSTTDAVAAASTTITSVTANFTSAITGNIINLSGGTGSLASGWYQATFVSSTSITVDRSVATGTGITMNIGGSLATISQANTNSVDLNTIYVKGTGPYTETSTLTVTLGLTFIGYTTTRGDNGLVTWNTSTDTIDLITFNNGNNPPSGSTFNNFVLLDTAGTPGDGIHTINGSFNPALSLNNCSLRGFNIGILGDWQAAGTFLPLTLFNTEVKTSVSHGVSNSGPTQIVASYIHNNGGDGVRITQANLSSPIRPFFINQSIIYHNTGVGVNNQVNQVQGGTTGYGYLVIVNSDIVQNGGDGIQQTQESTGGYSLFLANDIIDSNGGFGVDQGTSIQLMAFDINNFYRSNTGGDTNNWTKGANDVVGTADPFVSRASNNFALNTTAGGGAAARNAGFPGVLQIGGTGSISIGALQPAAGAGGGQVAFAIIQ